MTPISTAARSDYQTLPNDNIVDLIKRAPEAADQDLERILAVNLTPVAGHRLSIFVKSSQFLFPGEKTLDQVRVIHIPPFKNYEFFMRILKSSIDSTFVDRCDPTYFSNQKKYVLNQLDRRSIAYHDVDVKLRSSFEANYYFQIIISNRCNAIEFDVEPFNDRCCTPIRTCSTYCTIM